MAAPAEHVFIALLAGGRGTRFWPLSRRRRPKQLLDVTGEGPLLRRTLERVAGLVPERNVLAVTSADLAREVRALLGLPRRNVLVEPSGRNTAPAVGLALLVAATRHPDAVLVALPSDHHVARPARLRAALRTAVAAARRLKGLVLVGLEPERADPGFGYIVPGAPADARGARRVTSFVEKPPAARAARLVQGGALWNAGMFCLHASSALEEIAHVAPDLARPLERLRPHVDGPGWAAALEREWPSMPSEPFDRAVIERSRRVAVVPVSDLGWSDVGSWPALARLLPADALGNRTRGRVVTHDSTGCLVLESTGLLVLEAAMGSQRTVVLLGARDLVVIDAGDVVLVADGRSIDALPGLVARLEREHPETT